MKVDLTWNQKFAFDVASASGQSVHTDARPPLGEGKGMAPKELLLSALGGCTAMDVAGLLHKNRQDPETFRVSVDAELSAGGSPKVFTGAFVTYELTGAVDPAVLLDAVKASQTKFCGVTAMLSKAFPVRYEVRLNGTLVGSGNAEFGA